MKNLIAISIIGMALLIGCAFSAMAQQEGNKPKIQIALILDTSNSMDGLIDQAKSQLWNVVNAMATARYQGKETELEIALYEYGNDKLSAAEGHIRLVSNFTTDLDKISEDLFSLVTDGGNEYCGQVIDKSLKQLLWSKQQNDLKVVFIAGNEPFDQGPVDYRKSCAAAINNGVLVNTIFCGVAKDGVKTYWKNGADLAEGKYMNIDHNEKSVYVDSPYDDDILKKNIALNKTYVSYGREGRKMKGRQYKQDANAAKMSKGSMVQRGITKSSMRYKNSSWDLVDALDDENFKIDEVAEENLPDDLRGKTKAEKLAYIKKQKETRLYLQSEIKALNNQRKAFVAEKQKDMAQNNVLDAAMVGAIKDQAKAKGYNFVAE